jgi:carbon starvation protein
MPVLPFILVALCVFTLAYRYYSAFLAARVLSLNPAARTPAHEFNDGQNYYPTHRWVLFGHHFAAITGAGPLIGPVLAAQFGVLPGFLWLVIGVVLGGAVHDMVVMTASVRTGGQSIAKIAAREVSPLAGAVTSLAILFIVVIALAGLGLAVVHALSHSAWGVFTVGMSIPLAVLMGVYIYVIRGGAPKAILQATVFGVAVLLACILLGKPLAHSGLGKYFVFTTNELTFGIGLYGFVASVLPVWMLLCPRDYLSSYLKLGTIGFLVIAVMIVQPELRMPATTLWMGGGGPIIPGKVFPFVFITIACGAISGFHSLIASGTTPKMISNELDIRPIAYGAMLLEGLVGVVALIAAAALYPEDYFAINVSAEKFAALGLQTVNLDQLEAAVGESVRGRTGGAVSLAVGIAQIFSSLPWMEKLLAYWYHFAIMFEALFILTTIDTGTRVARFLVQEAAGDVLLKVSPGLARKVQKKDAWIPAVASSALVVCAWMSLIFTGSISTIWPMFGIANQLLAAIALAVGGAYILRTAKKQKYVWVTLGPLIFLSVTTITGAVLSIRDSFLPAGAYFSAALAGGILILVGVLLVDCFRRYKVLLRA